MTFTIYHGALMVCAFVFGAYIGNVVGYADGQKDTDDKYRERIRRMSKEGSK